MANVKYIRINVSLYDIPTKEKEVDFGTHVYVLPYISANDNPGLGSIANNQETTTLYEQWYQRFYGFNLMCKPEFILRSTYESYINSLTYQFFLSLFPGINICPFESGLSSKYLVLERVDNAKVMAGRISSSSAITASLYFANSISDLLNDIGVVRADNISYLIKTTPENGSGRTKGTDYLVGYNSVDGDGNIAELTAVRFYGITSTQSDTQINNVFIINNVNVIKYFKDSEEYRPPTPPSDDPYSGGGTSEPGGGQGTVDFTSEDVPIPTAPSLSAVDAGFLTLYRPSSSQLKSLATYMWAGAFDYQNFRKLFADPMDAIIGCHIIPITAEHPTVGTDTALVIGNIATTVSMPPCTEQYFKVECGTLQVLPKWGAYLDFSPYSKLSLYLPYIGIVELSPDDCMNGSIKVEYSVDILSGSCVAFVYCYSNSGQDGHVLYTFNGDCHCPVPITSGQYANAAVGIFRTIMGVGRAGFSAVSGNIGGAQEGIESSARSVQSMIKPEITRSGAIGGSAGLMGIQKPFLILTVPKMCIPGEQNTYIGYPSFVTMQMSDLTGYTEIQVSHLNNMSCTQEEAEEIISLLESGVIF